MAEGNTAYISLDGVLFNKTRTELLQYPVKKPGDDYVIASGITSIGYAAFAGGGANLTSLTIPASVASIDDHAFYYSTSLK